MKRIFPAFLGITLLGFATFGTGQEPAKSDAVIDPIEVQTRGPLHEAYAQPFDLKPEPGPMIPKEPPPPVPEEPPEQKPEADNAQWIPGYWAWDAQRQEFMWVSGVYRVPPQGRTFIPGYWQHTAEGWRWINGFWSDSNQQELPYTPEPPATLDQGPAMPAPDDNSTYIPGVWVYRDTRFIWRPGYYAPVRVGRVWHPPYYLWTPNGYLFIDGYWDYPFEDRGLIFAPVCFNRPLWLTAGWRYRPSFVVGFDSFFDSCFVGGGGFYFGNYYDPFYARHGYRPWYDGRGRYDPVFAYHGWRNYRTNPNWIGGVQTTYAARSAGRVAAPPLTFAAQSSKTRVVTPLSQFTSTNVKLVTATPTQIETQRTFAKQTQQIAVNRSKVDAVPFTRSDPPRTFRAAETRSTTIRTPTPINSNAVKSSPGVKSLSSPPRITTPSATPAPRIVTPPPLRTTVPPPAKKASIHVDPPRVVTQPAPAVRTVTPASVPRVQYSAPPRVQSAPVRSSPPPRVSTPPRFSPPARSSPPPRPANNNRKR